MADSPTLIFEELAEGGDAGAAVKVNESLRRVEALLARGADAISSTPPGSPAEGDTRIIGSAPSGDFAAFSEHDFVHYQNGAWASWTPPAAARPRTWLKSLGFEIVFDGTEWIGSELVSLHHAVASAGASYQALLGYASKALRLTRYATHGDAGTLDLESYSDPFGTAETHQASITVSTTGASGTSFSDDKVGAGRWLGIVATGTPGADFAFSLEARYDPVP